jgi:aspartyl-tRNA(Asn)/glutamyl-tRNA(Gln) amidotransferase subunit B
LQLLFRKKITRQTAKQLLTNTFNGKVSNADDVIVDDDLLLRTMLDDEYEALGRAVLDANPREVSAIIEKGQKGKVMFLVGQAMRMGQEGRVEAQKAKAALEKLLRIQ